MATFCFLCGGFFVFGRLYLDFLDGRGQHRETLFGGRSLFAQASEFPEFGNIAAVVARLVDGRFEDESATRQGSGEDGAESQLRQDAMKGFSADFAFANVFVAIDASAERNFRIVGVEDGDAVEADRAVDYVDCRGRGRLHF